jgi:predicted AlkP superfamily phosphohydrolase/phosphomutase
MEWKSDRVLVIGLDSTPPRLLFEEFKESLPNLSKLVDEGINLRLRSCHPPITIPAWMVSTTGKDPGEMGIYGFRHRKNFSYKDIWISTSDRIRVPRVWDVLAREGKRSTIVGVPPSYPPYEINGHLVSCFITPDSERDFTHPSGLKGELQDLVGEYLFDVVFRTEDRDNLLKGLLEMTEKNFQVIEYLIKEKPWEFFMFVEIGVDRVQHAFWKYFDSTHPKYEPNHKYENAILDYYKVLDTHIGRLLSMLDETTSVIVMSDHGAKAMKGAFCINEWLIQEGYLVLKNYPEEVKSFGELEVDWSRTRAWGWGGYHARIFINKEGREQEGIVQESDYEALREELIERLTSLRGPAGEVWKTRAHRIEDLYPTLNGDYPDLMVYLDDLFWRSAGTVGRRSLYLGENDTGPDDAVHDWDGIFVLWDKRGKVPWMNEDSSSMKIEQVASVILRLFGSDSQPQDKA